MHWALLEANPCDTPILFASGCYRRESVGKTSRSRDLSPRCAITTFKPSHIVGSACLCTIPTTAACSQLSCCKKVISDQRTAVHSDSVQSPVDHPLSSPLLGLESKLLGLFSAPPMGSLDKTDTTHSCTQPLLVRLLCDHHICVCARWLFPSLACLVFAFLITVGGPLHWLPMTAVE